MSILTIVLLVLGAWLAVSVVLALFLGRAVQLADGDQRRRMARRPQVATPVRARARVLS
ncbi:hypothetical protein [uncultured Amnibacterium sp.]|uniref:hypothetical protein n=1 Tax=uncultured Amnibacterium sp. TaxID=1631851 RepID=UPI0035CA3C98